MHRFFNGTQRPAAWRSGGIAQMLARARNVQIPTKLSAEMRPA